MLKLFLIVLLVFVGPIAGYSQEISKSELEQRMKFKDMQMVSIISLIASPKQYHNKLVMIRGYLNLEFEGNAVYLSETDYKQGIIKNAFWVDTTDDMGKNPQNYSRKYCQIVGTFNGKNKGHMGAFSGAISNVIMIDCWEKGRE